MYTLQPWGRGRVTWTIWDTRVVVEQIESLREPYRGNLITWLERFTMEPIQDLDVDLHKFFTRLNPVVREEFVNQTRLLLQDAVRFFGVNRRFAPIQHHAAVGRSGRMHPGSAT